MIRQPVAGCPKRFLLPPKLTVQWHLRRWQVVQPNPAAPVFLHVVRLDAVARWHCRLAL